MTQQAAEELAATNASKIIGIAGVRYLRRSRGCLRQRAIVEALVWAMVVVIANVATDNVIEMRTAETQEIAETFAFHGTDPGLRECVRVRRLDGRFHDPDIGQPGQAPILDLGGLRCYGFGMPRVARIVVSGWPHHVVQRGNNRRDVFFVDDDRRMYLKLLRERCHAGGVRILAYCLMTNHVHLIAVPRSEDGRARAIGRTHFLYTQYINRLHGRSGHLWQNRFFSCALEDSHLWAIARYVERNPVRARMVRLPWRYPWSSAAVHTDNGRDAAGVLDLDWWTREWTPRRWEKALRDEADEGVEGALLAHTHRPAAGGRQCLEQIGMPARPPAARGPGWATA